MIYKYSRYTNTPVTVEDTRASFKIRKRLNFNQENARVHVYTKGDTLDGLAKTYLGTSQLWWVILEANSQYRSPLDIKYGDNLVIPSKEEVIQCLKY